MRIFDNDGNSTEIRDDALREEVLSIKSDLKWESSNDEVATVFSGKVTKVADGTCTITARTYNGICAKCEIS